MKLFFIISSLVLVTSTIVINSTIKELDVFISNKTTVVLNTETNIESLSIHNPEILPIAIEDIHVLEMEEELTFNFNPKKYLPENFNPLKGKHDLDWNKISLVELEEAVEIGFNVQDYLPKGFNPNKLLTKHKLCSKII